MVFKVEWKDVPEYEDLFMVSTTGEVWSKRTSKMLKQNLHKSGYKLISTKIGGRDGKYKTLRVARMVALAFLDKEEGRDQVNHIDGNKHNNFVTNLEWVSGSENVKHAYQTGLAKAKTGLETGKTALSKCEIEYVKSVYKNGCRSFGARALGRKFSVPHKTIIKSVNFST